MKIFNIEIKTFDFREMNWCNLCYSYKDYDDALKAYHNTKNGLLIEAKSFCNGGVQSINTYEHTSIVNDKDNEVHFKILLDFDFSKEEHLNIYSYLSLPTNLGRFVEADFKKILAQHRNAMYAVQLCSVKLVEIELL